MQTQALSPARSAWPEWAAFLQRRGLDNLVAWMLEAAGPLTVLGAQVIYLGLPLLRPAWSGPTAASLAGLLEDPQETRSFASYLREEVAP